MKNILRHVVGFRTDRTWKKVIAIFYYLSCLLMLTTGIGEFLVSVAVPFALFGVIGTIKHKDKISIAMLVIAIAVLGIGGNLTKPIASSKVATSPEKVADNKPVPTTKEVVVADNKIEAKTENVKANSEAVKVNNGNVTGELKVHYIDVGQADSILIQQ
ncbi:MAG TPA: hypothetical protein VIK26_04560, partial [Clostridium sp.]